MFKSQGVQEREAILQIASGAKTDSVDIHQALDVFGKVPVTPSEFAGQFNTTEKTARNLFRLLESQEIILSTASGAQLTGIGHMIAREQQQALNELESETLAKLARAENWLSILRALQSDSLSKDELARNCGISKRTRRRACDTLVKEGWITFENNRYYLSSRGASKLAAFDKFKNAVAQITERKEFLLRLNDLTQKFPIAALRDTEMEVGEHGNPHAVLTLLETVPELDPGHLRGVQHTFSRQMVDAFDPMVAQGKETELIIDQSVYRKTTKVRNWHYLARGMDFANFKLLIHPENLSLGLGIFDDEAAIVGTYHDSKQYNAAISGTNDALVDWATRRYEEIHDQAQTPTGRFLDWFRPDG